MDYTFTNWFYGNEISNYGKQHKRVDYRAFAKSFEGVMANDLMSQTNGIIGYWEQESGIYYEDYDGNEYDSSEVQDRIEELEKKLEELEEMVDEIDERMDGEEDDKILANLEADLKGTEEKISEIERDIDLLQDPAEPEVFQWFIIDSRGAEICEEYNEIVYYNEEMDLYLWGVTHFGTSWDYVLTDIPCEPTEKEK